MTGFYCRETNLHHKISGFEKSLFGGEQTPGCASTERIAAWLRRPAIG
jgi:hypothetical protein